MKRKIADVDVAGRRVLMRVDFNVPLADDDGTMRITDDRRVALSLPSIRSVIDRGGRLILMSHLGRPKGTGLEPEFSLGPVAARLQEHLPDTDIHFHSRDCADPANREAAAGLTDGAILLLENLRFNPGEKKGDEAFASALAALAGEDGIYCNEAFGTSHRTDASMVAVPRAMGQAPKVAGLLLGKELRFLGQSVEDATAEPGFVAVLGGAKVSDKLAAIERLTGRVDDVLVGGAMAYTFLRAKGVATGSSLVEEGMIEQAEAMLAAAERDPRTTIHLPQDHVCGQALESGTPVEVHGGAIPDGWMGLDVGPETYTAYSMLVSGARTVVWNGPLGAFETPPFDVGTRKVAEAMASATELGATTIVGGGDSAAAIAQFGLEEQVSHVSTGGGASLAVLEGKRLEAVELLDEG